MIALSDQVFGLCQFRLAKAAPAFYALGTLFCTQQISLSGTTQ